MGRKHRWQLTRTSLAGGVFATPVSLKGAGGKRIRFVAAPATVTGSGAGLPGPRR